MSLIFYFHWIFRCSVGTCLVIIINQGNNSFIYIKFIHYFKALVGRVVNVFIH